MKLKKNRMHIKALKDHFNISGIFKIAMLLLIAIYMTSCESFLEIEPPKDKLVNETSIIKCVSKAWFLELLD